jgi:hypothetical protein
MRLYCVEADIDMQDFVAEALAEHFSRQSGKAARGIRQAPRTRRR